MISDLDEDERQRLRLRIIGIVAVSLFAALFARLWYLQALESDELQAQAAANTLRVVPEEGPRGRILDRSGRVLVDNKVVQVVTIDRVDLNEALPDAEDRREMFLRLALVVSRAGRLTKVADIENQLADPEFGPFDTVPVAFDVDPDLLVYLGERHDEFPGVDVVQRTVRSYPYGSLASHILGYVGPITEAEYGEQNAVIDSTRPDAKTYQRSDEIGKTGVERVFESELRGVPGRRVLEVDAAGAIIDQIDFKAPKPGNDVYLTIDIDMQALVEDELRDGLDRAKNQEPEEGDPPYVASAGAAVALDPRDGSVLALASFPTYDPREFVNGISARLFEDLIAEENFSPILNRAIQGEYAPGSTFKVVTSYAGLLEGHIGPGGVLDVNDFYEDTGKYVLPNCDEFDTTCVFKSPFRGRRGVDLRDAITVSSDTYFYRIANEGFFQRRRGEDEGIQDTARLLGFDSATGVGLPYERRGVIPDRDYFDLQFERGVFPRNGDQWFAGDTIQTAIGQGDVLVTPIQIANAYATIANGGRVHQPNIASRIVSAEGETVVEFGPRVLRDLDIPGWILDPILDGLNGVTATRVVDDLGFGVEGTGYEAFNRPDLGGIHFPLESWPVAGKTGTSQKVGKADFALFVGFGPAPWPEKGIERTPEVVVAAVLEEAGFGGDVAAPLVARILEPIATGTVERARTADEIDTCYSEVYELAQWFEGIRLGEIYVDSDGNVLEGQGEEPGLSPTCRDVSGGREAVLELGVRALSS
ncbi:MAG: penicillin-binding protein 2 [Acidimicrobiales bacterium]